MTQKTISSRSYRGQTHEERLDERRRRLIAAAIAVYGERGYRQASVKAVCEAAGLTERYFYESFSNSEALLIASYEAVTAGVFKEITDAAKAAGRSRRLKARAMLHAYFSALKREPRSARVFLVEIRSVSLAVDEAFDATLSGIAREVARIVGPRNSPPDELLGFGVVGGIIHIALRWIKQGYEPAIDHVVEAAMQLGKALFAQPVTSARRIAARKGTPQVQ
jgi:AcrR family transcriptional regulator